MSMKIFKRIAAFLRELSLDNLYVGQLNSLDALVRDLVESLFIENAEFATNLLAYNTNVLRYSGRLTDVQIVFHCLEKACSLEEAQTPQQYFMKHFAGKYKLAEAKPEKEEEVESDEDEMEDAEEIVDDKDDAVTSTLEFRKWRTLSKARIASISLLNDLLQFTSASADEEEEEYEEVDGDEDLPGAGVEESKTEQQPHLAAAVTTLARTFLPHILTCGKAI